MIKRMRIKSKKGDATWISTVLYTLIGLSIMGLLLAFIRPKIAEMKDSFVIEQTITSMNDFDKIVSEIRLATGNRRTYDMHLSSGQLMIDGIHDTIQWYLPESNYQFSEVGVPIQTGNLNIITEKAGDKFSIKIEINYSYLNITYNNQDVEQILQSAKVTYPLSIENKGAPFVSLTELRGKQQIDISG